MHRAAIQACFCALAACTAAAAGDPPFTLVRQIYTDDFAHGLAHWRAEMEKPGTVAAKNGALNVDVPAGCTLWFVAELEGPVLIRYEAVPIVAGGPNDRTSDLNAFWMATNTGPRSGKFAEYNTLWTYYVGQGGNTNTTTRFRRYVGDPELRPLLPEHDLRDADTLLKPNTPVAVQLVALGHRIQYYANGRLLFDFDDPDPYTRGLFAFRTTQSHFAIRNFSIWRIGGK